MNLLLLDMDLSHSGKYSKDEVIATFIDKTRDIFSKFDLEFVVLGGSVAEERHGWWSDIDIFVSYPQFDLLSTQNEIDFYQSINNPLLIATGYDNIEISIIEQLPIRIKYNICVNAELLFEFKEDTYDNFYYETLLRYFDHKIWIDRFYAYLEEY